MSDKSETAHQRFLRLMQKRLERLIEDFRLVRQPSSKNYESTEEERLEVLTHLKGEVEAVGRTYGVPVEIRIGHAAAVHQHATKGPVLLTAIQVAEIIDLLDYGRLSEALDILRPAAAKATELAAE